MVCCGISTLICALALATSYFVVSVSPVVIVIFCALTFCGNIFQFTASYMCVYEDVRTQIGVASAAYGFIQRSVTTIFLLLAAAIYLNNQIALGLLMAVPPLLTILLKTIDIKILKK